jgi:hypothetical protein
MFILTAMQFLTHQTENEAFSVFNETPGHDDVRSSFEWCYPFGNLALDEKE